MTTSKLSIITPTLNAARFIEGCVENVLTQGPIVTEHIIADGGSTDGTVELVERLMDRHPHLRFLPGPDQGQSDAMNKATERAIGDVIGVLNADDFYEPGAVADALRHLDTLGAPGFVCGDCLVIRENGRRSFWNRPHDLRLNALLLGDKYAPHPYNPSAYFYHRDVHFIVGGFDTADHYAMDVDFVLSAVAKVRTLYVPTHWGNFRLLPGGKTFEDGKALKRADAVINRHLGKLPRWHRLAIRLLQARIDAARYVSAHAWRHAPADSS